MGGQGERVQKAGRPILHKDVERAKVCVREHLHHSHVKLRDGHGRKGKVLEVRAEGEHGVADHLAAGWPGQASKPDAQLSEVSPTEVGQHRDRYFERDVFQDEAAQPWFGLVARNDQFEGAIEREVLQYRHVLE